VLKNNRIVGMVMYGDTTDSAWYLNLVKEQTDISAFRDQLIFGQPALWVAA
jgi:nitrite reductase (NADH) large subunit